MAGGPATYLQHVMPFTPYTAPDPRLRRAELRPSAPTRRRSGRTAPAPSGVRALLEEPRLVHHLPTLLAVIVFVATFVRTRQRWFIEGYAGHGYVTWVVQSTAQGWAIAPNQYRPLMPWVMSAVAEVTGLPLPTAILLVDAVLMLAAITALIALVARYRTGPLLLLVGALGYALWHGKLDHWHPELWLLATLVPAALIVIEQRRPSPWALAAVVVPMLGARTDYAAALAVVLIALGAHRRSAHHAALGVATGTAAGLAAIGWPLLFPQAHYRVDVVQLDYNLSPGSWLLVAPYYGVVLLVPALLAARRRALPPMWPALAWFLVEFGAVFVVGRVEESRIFLPLAAVVSIAAALAFLELRRDDATARRAATAREG